MEMQKITLSLPERMLRKIELLAEQRQTSVSELLIQYLEEVLKQETVFASARQRQLKIMEQGLNLGLGQDRPANREQLH